MAVLVRGKEVKRKTFVARADLLDRLSEVAGARGYSLYALVNEVFELFLKSEELGLDLRRVFEERGVLENAKRLGFALGLESLWYSLADMAYERAKSRVLKEWFDAGVWFARRYATSGSADPLEAVRRDLDAFMWNASQFSMNVAGERISIRVLGPRFSEGYTFLLAAFFEGMLGDFGFEIVEREVFKGNIRLEGVKKKKGEG
ncbi:MAG: hypothetical protein RMJ15_04175 [Nitrososphaerota archaeon]|nr:hypothetical protein [Nitrososphaerota archaeon]